MTRRVCVGIEILTTHKLQPKGSDNHFIILGKDVRGEEYVE